MYGKPAKSDPYLRVKLGDFKFDDRKHAVDDVTEVDFYELLDVIINHEHDLYIYIYFRFVCVCIQFEHLVKMIFILMMCLYFVI